MNLNRARKAKKRAEAVRQAAANRAVYGRTKAERELDRQLRARNDRNLAGKRLD